MRAQAWPCDYLLAETAARISEAILIQKQVLADTE
jgi:hypothetical protein